MNLMKPSTCSAKETLIITIIRGEHRVSHHIDCGILALVPDKESKASLLWGEYLIARNVLDHKATNAVAVPK